MKNPLNPLKERWLAFKLHEACKKGQLDQVQKLLKAGVLIEVADPKIFTLMDIEISPLISAIQFRQVKITQFLLESGADPYPDVNGLKGAGQIGLEPINTTPFGFLWESFQIENRKISNPNLEVLWPMMKMLFAFGIEPTELEITQSLRMDPDDYSNWIAVFHSKELNERLPSAKDSNSKNRL